MLVGFAAETENVTANAQRKLRDKSLDIVVANDVSGAHSGFDSDSNAVTILVRDNPVNRCSAYLKVEVANRILDEVVKLRRSSRTDRVSVDAGEFETMPNETTDELMDVLRQMREHAKFLGELGLENIELAAVSDATTPSTAVMPAPARVTVPTAEARPLKCHATRQPQRQFRLVILCLENSPIKTSRSQNQPKRLSKSGRTSAIAPAVVCAKAELKWLTRTEITKRV